MRSLLRGPLFPAALLLLLVLASLPAAADQAPSMREIDSSYGFDAMIRGIARSFAQPAQQLAQSAPPGFSEAWKRLAPTIFDPEAMRQDVEKQAEPRLSPDDRNFLFAYLKTPLGKKVTGLEIAYSDGRTAASQDEGDKLVAKLTASEPERLALYREMTDALSAVDIGEATALNLSYAVASGILAEAGVNMSDADLMSALRRNMGDVRGDIEKRAVAGAALEYRDLTVEEIRQYLSFLRSAPAQRYYDATLAALDAAMSSRAKRFGHTLAAAMRERKA